MGMLRSSCKKAVYRGICCGCLLLGRRCSSKEDLAWCDRAAAEDPADDTESCEKASAGGTTTAATSRARQMYSVEDHLLLLEQVLLFRDLFREGLERIFVAIMPKVVVSQARFSGEALIVQGLLGLFVCAADDLSFPSFRTASRECLPNQNRFGVTRVAGESVLDIRK